MGVTLEVLSAVLCVMGLTVLAWWLMSRLLRPLPGQASCILLPGSGGGEELEQSVRGYIFLRSLGVVKSTILIVDLGLDPSGREVALRLCARWPNVVLWPADDLRTWLDHIV